MDTRDPESFVINNHLHKKPAEIEQEKDTYTRFLGGGVEYTDKSFEDFATDPFAVVGPSAARR
jgi:hypothetical protein